MSLSSFININLKTLTFFCSGLVAQLVEHWTVNPRVVRSILTKTDFLRKIFKCLLKEKKNEIRRNNCNYCSCFICYYFVCIISNVWQKNKSNKWIFIISNEIILKKKSPCIEKSGRKTFITKSTFKC